MVLLLKYRLDILRELLLYGKGASRSTIGIIAVLLDRIISCIPIVRRRQLNRKRELVLKEFARAAQAVRSLPAWMLELEQQKKRAKELKSELMAEAGKPSSARKKEKK